MSLISWNNSLTLGIESVDEQHQELVRIINALHDAMLAGKTKKVVGTILRELATYTQVHFQGGQGGIQAMKFGARRVTDGRVSG